MSDTIRDERGERLFPGTTVKRQESGFPEGLNVDVMPVEQEDAEQDITGQPVPLVDKDESFLQNWSWSSFPRISPEAALYLILMVIGAAIRFWMLGDKPVHHDESLHAYFSWFLFRHYHYTYDPLTHGPFQFHAIALIYLLFGVSEVSARLLPALTGTALIGMPYFLRDRMGRVGALLAAIIFAFSPAFSYYSRFVRNDIYVALWSMMLVVGLFKYFQRPLGRYFYLACTGFILAYTSKETIFITMAIYGSFFAGSAVYELGKRLSPKFSTTPAGLPNENLFQAIRRNWEAWAAVMLFFGFLGLAARYALGWLHIWGDEINQNPATGEAFLASAQRYTPFILLLLAVAVLVFVIWRLIAEQNVNSINGAPVRPLNLFARWLDRERQPVLYQLATMDWTHWFIGGLIIWAVYLVLFTTVFTNSAGISDGLFKGLYYWLTQQKVARGDQPWYYYITLISLYEQLAIVFGVVGIIRCLTRPNRFRLFLVYWFFGALLIYSWAGEKMPWLVLHILVPLILLAGVGGEWAFAARRTVLGAMAAVVAGLLFLLMVHSSWLVNYVDAADAPREMLVYVQTTPDVLKSVSLINDLGNRLYHDRRWGDVAGLNPVSPSGKDLKVVVTSSVTWPFAWYLRDYAGVSYPQASTITADPQADVVLVGIDDDATIKPYMGNYVSQHYQLRSWFQEGYKSKEKGGKGGVWAWLTTLDTPDPSQPPSLSTAAVRVWNWLIYRVPFQEGGSYDYIMYIHKGLPVAP